MIPKFRAWNTKSGRFAKDGELFLSIDSENYNLYSVDFDNFRLENDNYILMQSTGLKDKNGVEIYEGDIVKTVYKTGCVEYCEKQARYNIYLKSKDRLNEMNFMKNMADECEVIGNRYEDSDLIK